MGVKSPTAQLPADVTMAGYGNITVVPSDTLDNYVTIDIDALDPSHAPGAGAPKSAASTTKNCATRWFA